MTIEHNILSFIAGVKFEVTSFNIVKGIGKGFNTCTCSSQDNIGSVGDTLDIIIDGKKNSFIVTDKTYVDGSKISYTCGGLPSILEQEALALREDYYTNSNELILDNIGNIELNNNIPNIDFKGQSYWSESNSLSRIIDMVNVVGGDVFEVDGVLTLTTFKTIPQNPQTVIDIPDANIISYSYSDKIGKFNKTNKVLINPKSETLYSNPDIEFVYDGSFGNIYFNPSLSSGFEYTIIGLNHQPPTTMYKSDSILLTDATSVVASAGIDTMLYMLLDGEIFTDYELFDKTNIIRFLYPISGTLEYKFATQGIGVNITSTTPFLITYQCMKIQDLLVMTTNNLSCSVKMLSPLTYQKTTTLQVNKGVDISFIFFDGKVAENINTDNTVILDGGGQLSIKHRYTDVDWLDLGFLNYITSSLTTVKDIFTGTVVYDTNLGLNVMFLPSDYSSVDSIYYGNTLITGWSYNNINNPPYIELSSEHEGKSMEVTYTQEVVNIEIPPPHSGHPVVALDVIACGGLHSFEYVNSEDMLCSLPATFNINVKEQFALSLDDVVGKTLLGDFGTLVVDDRGLISISVYEEGEFVISCDSIRTGAEILVDSRGVV